MQAEDGDPEQAIERDADELEHHIDQLDDHIKEARDHAAARAEETEEGGIGDVAGDWEDTDDQAGGEDPEGAG